MDRQKLFYPALVCARTSVQYCTRYKERPRVHLHQHDEKGVRKVPWERKTEKLEISMFSEFLIKNISYFLVPVPTSRDPLHLGGYFGSIDRELPHPPQET